GVRMRREYLFFLFFSVLSVYGNEAFCAENSTPSVHNEYHNSTIYSGGMPQEAGETSSFPPEGIYTYDDPETGDHVISVRSHRSSTGTQQAPVIVEPIVRPF
ncbi:MAG: hypothetical protein J5803_03210, partial [Desulfovibrio sp.]|nr:hypothetical protein [Desulfovibrio sp.]